MERPPTRQPIRRPGSDRPPCRTARKLRKPFDTATLCCQISVS